MEYVPVTTALPSCMEIVPAGQTSRHNPQPIQKSGSILVVTEFCIYQERDLWRQVSKKQKLPVSFAHSATQANPSNSLRISTRLTCFIIFSFTWDESGLKNWTPIPISPTLGDLFTQTTTVMT